MTPDMINYLAWIVGLLITGILFLKKKVMWFVIAFSAKREYDPDKVNLLIGWTIVGLAVSLIPTLLSAIFNALWLNFFSAAMLIVILIIIPVIEFGGKLNK